MRSVAFWAAYLSERLDRLVHIMFSRRSQNWIWTYWWINIWWIAFLANSSHWIFVIYMMLSLLGLCVVPVWTFSVIWCMINSWYVDWSSLSYRNASLSKHKSVLLSLHLVITRGMWLINSAQLKQRIMRNWIYILTWLKVL